MSFWSDSDVSLRIQDKPLRVPAQQAIEDFDQLSLSAGPHEERVLLDYCDRNLLLPGSDLVVCQPADWQPEPANFLPNIGEPHIRQWALDVHTLWKTLCRKQSDNVKTHPDRHSLLAVPHPIVIPGSRFREGYYWDTFWILKGLLVSGMHQTAAGMVRNLVALAAAHGHVPNGMRSYYLNRSQPPLLSAMVKLVADATGDEQLIAEAYPMCEVQALLKEHEYWTLPPKLVLIVRGTKVHRMTREDVKTAEGMLLGAAKKLFTNLASAAESGARLLRAGFTLPGLHASQCSPICSDKDAGWDFSSRWMHDGRTLASCCTADIVPVDLNAFMYQMESNMAAFAARLGHEEAAATFSTAVRARRAAIDELMHDRPAGQWFDLLITSRSADGTVGVEARSGAYASNYVPLWVGLAEPGSQNALAALAAFKASGLLGPAGVAASVQNTGQQWDYPNAWPPLQDIIIEAFANTGGSEGQALAKDIAHRFLRTMHATWCSDTPFRRKMVEKWDASAPGGTGGGGEYRVQTGFGWSNGVMLSLLSRYGWKGDGSSPEAI